MPGRHHKSVADAARVMTEDVDDDNRVRAAIALEQIAPIEALGAFVKGLEDEYNLVRKACAGALVKIDTEEAREALKTVLEDEDADVQEIATNHLNARLFQAVVEEDKGSISQLLQDGADVNAKDNKGRTALMVACWAGCAEIVQALIAAGADVNLQETKGGTALMHASGGGHAEPVKALLAAGADINLTSKNGATALLLASMDGHETVVQALLADGANVDISMGDGGTALTCAKTAQIEQLLRAAGATE